MKCAAWAGWIRNPFDMAAQPPILKTDRLTLRPLVTSDAAALHPVFARDSTMQYWSSGAHQSLQETEAYLSENAKQDPWVTWAITQADNMALGWVSLNPQGNRVAEIGYILNPDFGGNGLASEAVSGVITHAFEDRELRRIKADVDPDNAGSLKLLERLGFVREGYLRAEWETHIGVRDSIIFGLLREEWQSAI